MESRGYTLANEQFAFLVELFGKTLTNKNIPHTLVGGVATQAHVLSRMCQLYRRDVTSLVSDESIGDSDDYLRATSSVDFALSFSEYDLLKEKTGRDLEEATIHAHEQVLKKIYGVCNAIYRGSDSSGLYLSPGVEHLYTFRPERSGLKKIDFNLGVDNQTTGMVRFKIAKWSDDLIGDERLRKINPLLYQQFIDDSEDVRIPFSLDYTGEFKVINPFDLLTIKIALDRPKDHMDASNLVNVLREVGELEPLGVCGDLTKKFIGGLRSELVPNYENQLLGFGCSNGFEIRIPYKEKQDTKSKQNRQ